MDSAITCAALAGVEGFMAQSMPSNTASLFDAGLAERYRMLLVAHVGRKHENSPGARWLGRTGAVVVVVVLNEQ